MSGLYLGSCLAVLGVLAACAPVLRGPVRLAGDLLAMFALSASALPAGPLAIFPLLVAAQAAFAPRFGLASSAGLTAIRLALSSASNFNAPSSVLYAKVSNLITIYSL